MADARDPDAAPDPQTPTDPLLHARTPENDPTLRIPELLQQPVRHPSLDRKPRSDLGGLGELMKALAIGVDFLCTVAAGALIGWGLDRWLGWTNRALMIGLAVGFAYGTVRLLQRTAREEAQSKSRAKTGSGPFRER